MIDYIGLRSGRLVIISFHHKTKSNHKYFICKCDCGKEVIVRGSSIVQQKTKSCGCLAKEKSKERGTKHGMFGTRIYRIWSGIKRRCYDPKVSAYKWYGGKGINYCKEWESFSNFYEWAKNNGYKDNLTIDRIDVNGNYCPENCRWIDDTEQARNRSNNKIIEYNGEKHCLSEWSEIYNINYETLLTRIRRGFPFEEVLNHEKYKQYNKRKKYENEKF